MSSFFHTLFYQPLYNGLILLMDALPWFDAGIIIVLFTLIVKLALFPLSKKAVVAQIEMKRIEPELKKIKEKYKDNSQEQARLTMALYKEKKINPFSSLVTTLIQLPIIFALYFVFLRSGLPIVNQGLMYSFTPSPHSIDMNFLGLINIVNKSIVLAALAGLSSFFQIRFSMPAYKPTEGVKSFRDDLSRSMNLQMRYIFPVIIFFISLKISGAVALYWVTSNVFTLAQEYFVLKKLRAA